MARKLTKTLNAKKSPRKGRRTLVIGSPQDFKKGSSATDFLLELGVPTLRGGYDADSEPASKSESPDDDTGSVLSLRAFAEEYKLPQRTSRAASPLAHRHAAPLKVTLPNPLRSNPPDMTSPPPPPPVAFELEGSSAPLTEKPVIHDPPNSNSGVVALRSNRHKVIYGHFDRGSPLFPTIEQVEDIPLSESEFSASSGQTTPIAKATGQKLLRNIDRPRSSQLPTIWSLPFEMREPLKIWQGYTGTGIIDVAICPEVIDSDGQYTWIHCWGLFNIYTFGASFMNDTEFADRVMDMLCNQIKPGKAADIDTICLVFTVENISLRLKRLVVDRCFDAGADNFHHSFIKSLPHDFAAFALEEAIERLINPNWLQQYKLPCRYHRHKRAEDCYLRKLASERDRQVIANRKARKSRFQHPRALRSWDS